MKHFLFISVPILIIYAHFFLVHPLWEYRYYDLSLKRCTSDPSISNWSIHALPVDRSGWSIHGLWAEFDIHHWPQFCQPQSKLNLTLLDPIKADLKKYWYSCIKYYSSNPMNPKHWTDETFWEHEWVKHGTCSGFSQFDYFNETLHLFKQDATQEVINYYCPNNSKNCLIHLYLNETLKPFIKVP